ncbi:MAG: DUF4422 domain-containing protein [Selenomonadaceae bacterium]|nr:DUF4422 domain-containing protein [Selenomonadaceae bacterium]
MLKILAWIVSNDSRYFNAALNILARQHNGVDIVAVTANTPINLASNGKKIPFVPLAEASSVEYDFVLVIGAKQIGMTAINNVVNQLKFPTEKILPDFVVSAHSFTIEKYLNNLLPLEKIFASEADFKLFVQLQNMGIKTLLDVDAHFAKGQRFTKIGNDLTDIDCIAEEPIYPLKENFYRRIYKNLSEVGYRHYAVAIIEVKTQTDFIAKFNLLENISDMIILYVSASSELQKFIPANGKLFTEVKNLPTELGNWFIITRKKKPEDFAMYVVTHKKTPQYGKLLSEGYKIIHAGRALGEDLGYLGDNTGDNISELNPYLNEVTALYWMWKNTSHTVIGLCHYRRFFSKSKISNSGFDVVLKKEFVLEHYDWILDKESALKILQDYDIITVFQEMQNTVHETIVMFNGEKLAELGEAVTQKYLLKYQPDYLDAFDFVFRSYNHHRCQMIVTRRDIFDAYCKWLFSFIIDATNEILGIVDLKSIPGNPHRIMAYMAEMMLSVWMLKTNLQTKELNSIHIAGI